MTMRYRFTYLILTLAMVVCCTAMAGAQQIYQYTDDSGTVIFTDDISAIPESKRQSVMTEPPQDQATDTVPEPEPTPEPKPASPREAEYRTFFDYDLPQNPTREQLEQVDIALNLELSQLKMKQAELIEARKSLTTYEEMQENYQQVQALNQRIDKYQEAFYDFSKLVEQYNNAQED